MSRTGLHPATTRAWERCKGLPRPTRKAGGHRQYSQRDIGIVRWLIAHQDEGVSISHSLDSRLFYIDSEEEPLQAGTSVDNNSTERVTRVFDGDQIDQLRNAWFSACLGDDRKSAEVVLVRAFALYDMEKVYIELLQRGLVDVSNGWYNGEVTGQQKHFTSALRIQRLMILIFATPPPSKPERIIVTTALGDFQIFTPLL